MSFRKADPSDSSNEKIGDGGPFAGGLLSRASTRGRDDNGRISSEVPRRRYDGTGRPVGGIGLLAPQSPPPQSPPPAVTRGTEEQDQIETYREGRNLIFEDQQGDVITQTKTPPRPHEHHIGPLDTNAVAEKLQRPFRRDTNDSDNGPSESTTKHKPAMAFRFDDNIIVEDEDGEVIKRYKIPKAKRPAAGDVEVGQASTAAKNSIFKTWFGFGGKDNNAEDDLGMITDEEGDLKLEGKRIRLRDAKGRKLNKQQFIHELKMMDPHARRAMVSQSSFFPEEEGGGPSRKEKLAEVKAGLEKFVGGLTHTQESSAKITEKQGQSITGLALVDSEERVVPYHDVGPGVHSPEGIRTAAILGTAMAMAQEADPETSAERRRREAALGISSGDETSAERRRREAALGMAGEDSDDSDDDGAPRVVGQHKQRKTREIRFAPQERGQRQRETPGAEGSGSGTDSETVLNENMEGTGATTPGRVIQFAEDTKGKQRQMSG